MTSTVYIKTSMIRGFDQIRGFDSKWRHRPGWLKLSKGGFPLGAKCEVHKLFLLS